MNNFIRVIISAVVLVIVSISIWSFGSRLVVETDTEIHTEKSISKDSLFNAYWYAGKAEIRTYTLSQARYGEMHQGKATLIFVAQPFLKNKGVKPDSFRDRADRISVLKMNLLKKFGTGIYPYAMMMSTFVPIDEPEGVTKASITGQEWCGHVFSQMNKRKGHYDVVSYSYFEEEGDQQFTLPTTFTEDEVWSRIRLDYNKLPVGEIDIIPGLYYTRLEQYEFQSEKAIATLTVGEEISSYSLIYPEKKRTLAITFNTTFPHEIVKWEETYADKRAPTKRLTTTAILDQSKNIDYWNYNAEKYKSIRKELGVLY